MPSCLADAADRHAAARQPRDAARRAVRGRDGAARWIAFRGRMSAQVVARRRRVILPRADRVRVEALRLLFGATDGVVLVDDRPQECRGTANLSGHAIVE